MDEPVSPFQPLPQDHPDCIVECRACTARWAVYRQQLGLPLRCPACGAADRPVYVGTTGTGSGSQVAFSSFRTLLDDRRVLTMIETWLTLRHVGGEQFVDAADRNVPLADIHHAIQGRAEWQGALYNVYMNRVR